VTINPCALSMRQYFNPRFLLLPPLFVLSRAGSNGYIVAKTELVVRPCVAFLHSYDPETGEDANVAERLLPRLDAREVAAVFSAPFR
jgi:hypothetical protein